MNIIHQGTIISGHYVGWKITINDDKKGRTGGYYIYIEDNGKQGLDYWCKDEFDLENQLSDFDVNYRK